MILNSLMKAEISSTVVMLLAKTTDGYAVGVVVILLLAGVIVFCRDEGLETVALVKNEPEIEPAIKPAESTPEPTEPQFTGVQILGVLFLLGGLGLGLIACFMGVTVSTGQMTVNNIGLMNDRLMFLMLAGFGFVSGLLMLLLGGKK